MPPPIDPGAPPRGTFAFFFYGTLCDGDVRAAVIGRAVDGAAATLADYEAVPVAGGRYPILLFQRGSAAHGVLCAGVTQTEAARLSLFEHEGRDYAARPLPVGDEAGRARSAWVYLPTAALRRGPGRWDLAEWQRFAKRDFLTRTLRAMRTLEPERLVPFLELWQRRAGAAAHI
jgi:hypothetical protein